MRTRGILTLCAIILSSGVALADTGNPPPNSCPPNSFNVGGVCIPAGCSVGAVGSPDLQPAWAFAAIAAAGLVARRRR